MDRYGNESEPLANNHPLQPGGAAKTSKNVWDGNVERTIFEDHTQSEVDAYRPTRLSYENDVLELPVGVSGSKVAISNSIGRVITTLPFSRYLRIGKLPRGCYWVKVQDKTRGDNFRKVGFFVKE